MDKETASNINRSRVISAPGAVLLLALLALVFCGGAVLGQNTAAPRSIIERPLQNSTAEKEIAIPSIIDTVIYLPVEIIVEKRIEVPQVLSRFQSTDELEQWLEKRDIEIFFIAVNDELAEKNPYDCDDYAINLQERAYRDGYLMSFEVIHPAEYNALFKESRIPAGSVHAINSVIIGNAIYYIEPQNNEIAFAIYID